MCSQANLISQQNLGSQVNLAHQGSQATISSALPDKVKEHVIESANSSHVHLKM
jgi:hypothetical protein